MSLSTNIPVICWNYTGMMHSSAGRKNPPVQCEPGDQALLLLIIQTAVAVPLKVGVRDLIFEFLAHAAVFLRPGQAARAVPAVRFNPSRMASTTCRSSLSRTFMARLLSDLYTHYNMYRPRPQYAKCNTLSRNDFHVPKFIAFIRNNFRHNLGNGVGNVPGFPPFPKISKFQAALWFREFFCNVF